MSQVPSGSASVTTPTAIDRRGFLAMCALLGLSGVVAACGGEADEDVGAVRQPDARTDATDRRVIVVGAGPAGLTAAHLLLSAGVDVIVLEAGSTYGGRTRRTLDFVDFPIPLGAEWLHSEPGELRRIANGDVDVELVGYGPDDTLGYADGALTVEPLDGDDDLKFVGSSWFDFFDEYVVPDLVGRMQFGTEVVAVQADDMGVTVTDRGGRTLEADAVVVTVPVAILRDRSITFVPDLSEEKWAAIDDVHLWGGFKAFFEFGERFYPTFLAFPDSDTEAGQRLYYDAAHGQASDRHVLGLFAVGVPAEPYQALGGDALRDHVLAELDGVFDGAATRSYLQHVTQDWSAERFVRQGYVADEADWRLVRTLGEPAGDRVFFAGDAYTDGEDWSSVHIAARSARTAVSGLLSTI